MEVCDHLFHAGDPSRHGTDHIELVSVVDAHVRIRRPNQYRVNSSVARMQIVEIAIDRVLPGNRIIEITILNHHLRLNEAALSPLKGRNLVASAFLSVSDSSSRPPVCDVVQPGLMGFAGALAVTGIPLIFRRVTRWGGDHWLLPDALGNVLRVLGSYGCHEIRGREKKDHPPRSTAIWIAHHFSSGEFNCVELYTGTHRHGSQHLV